MQLDLAAREVETAGLSRASHQSHGGAEAFPKDSELACGWRVGLHLACWHRP
jgi:hypothetical protein